MKYIDPEHFIYSEADGVNLDFNNNLTNVYCKRKGVFTTFENNNIQQHYPWFPPEIKLLYMLEIKTWKRALTIAKDVSEKKVKLE